MSRWRAVGAVTKMTRVSLMLGTQLGVELTVQPQESLVLVLERARIEAEKTTKLPSLQPANVTFSSSNAPVPGWNTAGHERAIGSQDVTVFLQAPPIADMLSHLIQRVAAHDKEIAAHDKDVEMLATPRISNAAAQVLFYTTNEFEKTPSSKFTDMGEGDPRIVDLRKRTQTTAQDLTRQLDGVVWRRNNVYTHFINVEALDTEVQECKEVIDRHPKLRISCKWECWVLENYEHVKAAFST